MVLYPGKSRARGIGRTVARLALPDRLPGIVGRRSSPPFFLVGGHDRHPTMNAIPLLLRLIVWAACAALFPLFPK